MSDTEARDQALRELVKAAFGVIDAGEFGFVDIVFKRDGESVGFLEAFALDGPSDTERTSVVVGAEETGNDRLEELLAK